MLATQSGLDHGSFLYGPVVRHRRIDRIIGTVSCVIARFVPSDHPVGDHDSFPFENHHLTARLQLMCQPSKLEIAGT